MIHVAIVEDEENYREQLENFVSRYGQEKKISIQTRSYCTYRDPAPVSHLPQESARSPEDTRPSASAPAAVFLIFPPYLLPP